ncbi:aminotransferase-like domain-containing protein [Tsukamurella paurometabola]|uniref:PLP-dependent aminotransferase family protein n=1 Tax=Tsukamurella paurometabola TaxID=2061 RepID=A0ABS5NF75_TSUPA|nr:PLP-dependent aminotransferase family protein [Tsukamurella paurometabola]MBS4102950.1 PLP-dependent aminotransferase family protein [Tsukamurella paurometabola]
MPRPPASLPDFWTARAHAGPGARSSTAIAEAVLDGLDRGALHPGDALPSSRALAAGLGVARNTVIAAYDTLAAMGVTTAVPGSGTRIAPGTDRFAHALHAAPAPRRAAAAPSDPGVVSLEPGVPDVTLIDRRRWRSSWRHAVSLPPTASPATHVAALQEALAVHLRRRRAVRAAPDDLRLFPGVNPALAAIAGHVGGPIAVETPGYRRAFDVFHATGRELLGLPVDADGVIVERLPRRRCLVYTTPAHQYPTGVRLSMERRLALVDWARATGSVIVEDDYDGEFSYDVAPLPALQTLAPDHVVYLGTASKALSPQLRLAWAAIPESLRALPHTGHGSSAGVDGTAASMLAHFLDSGAWDAHVARAARTYGARRAAVRRALAHHLPDALVLGADAGLHLTVDLGSEVALRAAVAALARHGYRVSTLAAHALAAGDVADTAMLLSYALIPETRADAIIALLRA